MAQLRKGFMESKVISLLETIKCYGKKGLIIQKIEIRKIIL